VTPSWPISLLIADILACTKVLIVVEEEYILAYRAFAPLKGLSAA